jgi:hypothetical protein
MSPASAPPVVVGGVLAGLAGTAGYTAVSAALKALGVAGDVSPATVAKTLTGVPAAGSRVLNAALHWGYGGCCGLVRVGLTRAGLSGWRLHVAHLAAVWLPWRALLILSGRGRYPNGGALLADAGKHLVYVLGTGWSLRLLRGEHDRCPRT